jgi:Flp pilus assembly protein TadG
MKRELALSFRQLRQDESGAVIVLVAMMITGLIGLAALAVDVGNLAYTQRRLQATADMAALAGAAEIGCTSCASGTENTAANLYSGIAGSKNVQPNLTITMVSGYPKGRCLTGFGANSGVFYNANTGACTGLDNYNAMEVKEQATVPFTLGQIFGFGPVTLTATALAGASGTGGLPAMNVMIVLDTTASMNDSDTNGSISTCGVNNPTRIQCAMFGVRTLLNELLPSMDQVNLMVFPQVSTGTVSDDYSCSSSAIPTVEPYSVTSGATYQILSQPSDDYRASNSSSTLSGSSQLANAAGYSGTGSCAGIKAKGGEGTYYAGAINAAQAALVATDSTGVCATQTCQNVIIFLSDGGAGNASTLASMRANQNTSAGGKTLYLSSAVPSDVILGSSVADTTTNVITGGIQVVSISGSSVVISGGVGIPVNTSASTTTGGTTLQFASSSFPSSVAAGMAVADSSQSTNPIPSTAAVTSVTTGGGRHSTCSSSSSITCVTISAAITGTVNSGDTIEFGSVASGDTITFGTNNQCHEAITAAQNAASAGTWVYSIAYGASTTLSPPTGTGNNSCSDNEYPSISSCQTMGGGETATPVVEGIASDSTKFFSDGSGGSGSCTSVNTASDLGTIFQTIGNSLSYTALLPNTTD